MNDLQVWDTPRPGQPEQDMASPPLSDQLAGQQLQVQAEPEASPQYALDLYQVASLFDEAGLPRNRRSLSRYCTVGKLDCEKVETLNGEEWRVNELSVDRLTAQIQEQQKLTHTSATLPDTARQVAPSHPQDSQSFTGKTISGHDQTVPDRANNVIQGIAQQPTHDMTGHSQTAEDLSTPDQATPPTAGEGKIQENISTEQVGKMGERLIIQMERENDLLRDQLEKKDDQISNKDKQIDDLIERGREDKMLIQNFQRKLGMLSAPEEDRSVQNYQHPDQNQLPLTSYPRQGRQHNENHSQNDSPQVNSVDNSWGIE